MITKLLTLTLAIIISSTMVFSQSFTVTPSTGKPGDNLTVTIAGINTNFLNASQTQTQIAFMQGSSITNSIQVLSATATSNTTLLADIFIQSSAVIGKYAVRIFNSIDGFMNLPDGFAVVLTQAVEEFFGVKKSMKVYPNPATHKLTIQTEDAIQQIVISDLSGKTHFQHKPVGVQAMYNINLDEIKLPAQIYLVTVKTAAGIQTQKISIQ